MSDTPAAKQEQKPARPRPLSPHLEIYRLPLSALTSIAHRASGVALTLGAFVLVAWLLVAATHEPCFDCLQTAFATPVGMLALAGWVLAFYYHLCAGIRHLVWDAGFGFAKESFRFTNWVVVGAALVLTFCTLSKFLPTFSAAFGI